LVEFNHEQPIRVLGIGGLKMLSANEWDDRVLSNAVLFRVHRLKQGGHDEKQVESLKEARAAAEQALREGFRVLLYAIDGDGRSVLVAQKNWGRASR
jgi:hypothetical protein